MVYPGNIFSLLYIVFIGSSGYIIPFDSCSKQDNLGSQLCFTLKNAFQYISLKSQYWTYLSLFVAVCPLFDADLIFYTDGNCDETCPVNTVVIYLCEESLSGQATCTESSTWDQTCTPLGE